MNRGRYLTINKSSVFVLLCFVVLFEGNYWALLSILVGPASYRYIFWVIVLLICCVFLGGKFKKNMIMAPWLAYFILVIFRNQEIASGGYINTYRIVLCMLTLLIMAQNDRWIITFPTILITVSFPNVLATILFYINNNYYEKFVSATYRSYQSGTANGLYGYRAGIADHYSQNGTYITMVLLVLASLLLINSMAKKGKKYYLLAFALTAIALIMTEKRAHLLFSIATLLVVYLIGNSKRMSRKVFKLATAAVAILVFGGLFIDQLPMIQSVLGRFESVGTDSSITKRFFMWTLAINQFWKNPLFGSGFWGFMLNKENISLIIDASTGCHNIYIQLLSECGLIGLMVLIAGIISALYISIKNLRSTMNDLNLREYRGAIISSLAIQIFSLLYGFTGNMIYDRTFNFYILAVAASIAFYITHGRHSENRC